MKRRILTLLLTLVMVLSLLPGTALAVNDSSAPAVTYADLADINGTALVPDGAGENTELTVADAVRALLLWTGMTEQQLGSFPDDYLAQARSMGMIDADTDADAPCTLAAYRQMKAVADQMYDALHADKLQPLYMNGMAQPIFPYTTGEVTEGYSNDESDIIRYCVYVETNYDTDDDGKLDLVKALVQIPRAAMEGNYKAATIYEARPYITGCNESMNPGENLGSEGYDISKLYSQPDKRVPAGTATTAEAAANANSADWYYWNPSEWMYDYEDLNWYDYYLVRGFAVVECGGLGTKGSDGFETCGADLIDRDALMVSAMLVDIAPEGTTFPAYNTQGSYVPKTITAGGAWMGGGLNNYDYAELNATDVSYKIIARGWMDLCNPGAGYDSASAGTKVALKVGENHDYTIYLQPNLYTVKEGHKLALVIYTYEPGKANYSQNYQITLENASVSAEIPVDEIPAVPALPFTDVPADTELYDAVEWAYFSAPQITAGVTETTFAPANTCTRAEIVTFLYRLAGEPDVSGTALPFTDVAADAYYADAVKWAVANGVTSGTSATTFSPNDTCTRAQAVTLLYNAAGAPAVSDTVSFADVAADAYYANAAAWAAANGVTAGTSATTFSPDDACTRGQIVRMLYRGDTQA